MAIYGISIYGASFYGEEPSYEFDVGQFRADPTDRNTVKAAWKLPSEGGTSWLRLRLVRSSSGHPTVPAEGVTLFDDDYLTTRSAYTDTGLAGGRFYYYTLFILPVDESRGWISVGQDAAIAIGDYGYEDRLWELIPDIYRGKDADLVSVGDGPLRRFLSGFSLELDYIRGEYESLRDLHNVDTVSAGMLPVIAADLGAEVEPRLGDTLTRRYLRNAVWLYKRRGTLDGLAGLGPSLTGWRTEASYHTTNNEALLTMRADRINLIYNPSFEVNTDYWVAGAGTTLTRVNTWATAGDWALEVTRTAGDAGTVSFFTTAGAAAHPLTPNRGDPGQYQFNLDAEATGGTVPVTLRINWYASDGSSLGTAAVSDPMDVHTGAVTRLHVAAASPQGAARFSAEITTTLGAGQTLRVDSVLLEPHYQQGVYFDGDTTPITDHLWQDVTHGSPSHYYARREPKTERLTAVMADYIPDGVGGALAFARRERSEPSGWSVPASHWESESLDPTLSNGSRLVTWPDVGKHGWTLVGSTPSYDPPFMARGVMNGHNAAHFSPSTDATTSFRHEESDRARTDTAMTVMIVVEPRAIAAGLNGRIIQFQITDTDGTWQNPLDISFEDAGAGAARVRARFQYNHNSTPVADDYFYGPSWGTSAPFGRHLIVAQMGPSGGRFWVDNALVGTSDKVFEPYLGKAINVVEMTSWDTEFWIPEVIYFTKELLSTELAERSNHLNAKFNIGLPEISVYGSSYTEEY